MIILKPALIIYGWEGGGGIGNELEGKGKTSWRGREGERVKLKKTHSQKRV